MKTGKSINELAATIVAQAAVKKDFLADTRKLAAWFEDQTAGLQFEDLRDRDGNALDGRFQMNRVAEEQLADHVGVPRKFWDRMRGNHPDLLQPMVNQLLVREPAVRMVRTLDRTARALLSERYRPIDHIDLAEVVLPVLAEQNGWKIESSEITDIRLYIKAVSDRVQGEVTPGDIVQGGVCISNSEVGWGAVKVEPLVYRLICRNGAVVNDYAVRQRHVGGGGNGMTGDDGGREFWKDDTRMTSDKAVLMQMRDTVHGVIEEARFGLLLEKMRGAATRKIEGDVPKAVEVMGKKLTLAEGEQSSILRHLIEGGDLSQWGMSNAVTRAAADIESYDRATDLERVGWSVLELPLADWDRVAKAN